MAHWEADATKTVPITGPLGIGQVLDRAFRLYRARLGPLLLAGSLFLVPVGVANVAVTGSSDVTGFGARG